jgi:hypothetical protein
MIILVEVLHRSVAQHEIITSVFPNIVVVVLLHVSAQPLVVTLLNIEFVTVFYEN